MFIFDIEMENGALTKYHKVVKFEVHPENAHAVVNSYHKPEMEKISWQDTYVIPTIIPGSTVLLQITSIQDVELILTSVGAPFAGGVIVPEETETLENLRARKKAIVKIQRDKIEYGGIPIILSPTLTVTVDSDPDSQRKISGAVTMAMIAGTEFSVEWRFSDNSTHTLNQQQMIELGIAVGNHVAACQAFKNSLDLLLDAATTLEELQNINILTGWPGDEPKLPAPTITTPIVGAVE